MAISTFKAFLMKKGTSGETYTKLIDIKSFPNLGGTPESLETTTLSDPARTYIPGIKSQEPLEFTANYTKDEYTALKALEGTEAPYAVRFGGTESAGEVTPTGSDGKFEFNGTLSVSVNSGDVNAVVGMTISILPSSPVEMSSGS